MSRGPLVFGFPAWIGVKRRVGKTHLTRERDFRRRILVDWKDGKIGDLYSDCSGMNHRLAAVEPAYRRVGRRGGQVLMDLDFFAEDGSTCSFYHCGVGPPVSQAEAERVRAKIVRWALATGESTGMAIRYSPEVMIIHADGTFSTDDAAYHRLRWVDTGNTGPAPSHIGAGE